MLKNNLEILVLKYVAMSDFDFQKYTEEVKQAQFNILNSWPYFFRFIFFLDDESTLKINPHQTRRNNSK